MSEKTAVATAAAPQAIGPYLPGIAAGALVFRSGQWPADPVIGAMNEVYAASFPGVPPARATIEAARLRRDAPVEIDAITLRSEK